MSDSVRLEGLERYQPLILMVAVLAGLLVGLVTDALSTVSNSAVYIFLIGLMYGIGLGTPFKKVASSFRRWRFFLIALSLNFILIPLVGFALASLFLSGTPLIFVGFILYVVTPCTDWFLAFTGMAKGDVALGLALLPINLILQILLIPVYLWLFAGQIVPVQISSLIESVLVFIVLPFALAILTNAWAVRSKGIEWKEKLVLGKSPIVIQTVTLALVIFFMFAGQTKIILENLAPLSLVLIPVFLFIVISFFLSRGIGRLARLKYGECALLTCTSIARNSPLALAIAFGLFPDQPLIQVAIIVGVLIELPALVIVVRALLRGRAAHPVNSDA